MLADWSVITLLFSVAFGTRISRLSNDDPLVQKVKDIINNVDNYIDDHKLTSLSLPDLGILPLDPVKLTEGKLGQFDTIQSSGDPIIYQQQNKDGSTTYTFDVSLSLNLLMVQYQFHIKLPGPFSQDGQIILLPQKNVLQGKGIVVVGPGSSCDAKLSSADVVNFEDFQIDLEPNDIPFVTLVSETILNFVSPKLLPLTNTAIKAATLLPDFQKTFSDIVCKNIQ